MSVGVFNYTNLLYKILFVFYYTKYVTNLLYQRKILIQLEQLVF